MLRRRRSPSFNPGSRTVSAEGSTYVALVGEAGPVSPIDDLPDCLRILGAAGRANGPSAVALPLKQLRSGLGSVPVCFPPYRRHRSPKGRRASSSLDSLPLGGNPGPRQAVSTPRKPSLSASPPSQDRLHQSPR